MNTLIVDLLNFNIFKIILFLNKKYEQINDHFDRILFNCKAVC